MTSASEEATVELYLDVIDGVNNWDLVDATAHKILGPWLEHRDRRLLYDFARSNHLWRQRIAVIACLHFIRASDFDDFAGICDLLLNHKHDLIHKAVGWMLREAGKRDECWLREFLRPRYAQMPRTMLRYAIEKLDSAGTQGLPERNDLTHLATEARTAIAVCISILPYAGSSGTTPDAPKIPLQR